MPVGAVGDGFVYVFGGQDVGRQQAGFLKWRDVHAHAVVDVEVVAAFLSDEVGDVLGGCRFPPSW